MDAHPLPRVLYIGSFTGKRDEGMRKIAFTVAERAAARFPVLAMPPRRALSPAGFREIRAFAPSVIHYLAGPTVRSLAVLRVLRLCLRDVRTVASAVRPFFAGPRRSYLPLILPDLLLTQDPRWEALFRDCGATTRPVWNGVDTARFAPADSSRRTASRKALGIPPQARVVLHVGHLRANRNLGPLIAIQKSGLAQVVVVGSTGAERDPGVAEKLRGAGCLVLDTFIDAIEDVYAAADVYVFTVVPPRSLDTAYTEVGVIDTPLSVLEALAAGLPVLSTRMPALERLDDNVGAIRWFDGTDSGAVAAIETIGAGQDLERRGRAIAERLDWDRIVDEFVEAYAALETSREMSDA